MDDEQLHIKHRDTRSWIVVLAIAVTCCAILFLVFAQYLDHINKNLIISNTRLISMEVREDQLLREIRLLHQELANAQGGQAPVLAAPPAKASDVPSPTNDKPATPLTVPPGTPPTAPAVAPVTSPVTVPEIPTKH